LNKTPAKTAAGIRKIIASVTTAINKFRVKSPDIIFFPPKPKIFSDNIFG